jgi:hypothetical protein
MSRRHHDHFPNDLLTLVFEFAVNSLQTWALVQRVCRKFRRCALEPRTLSHFTISVLPEQLYNVIGARALHMQSDTTDDGLAGLAPLTRLRTLDLSKTTVAGAGLAHLPSLAQLQTLQLYDTEVTEDGITALRRLTPWLRIDWWGSSL